MGDALGILGLEEGTERCEGIWTVSKEGDLSAVEWC